MPHTSSWLPTYREQLSIVNPPVAAIRQTGILPRLVYLLRRNDNRQLQYEVWRRQYKAVQAPPPSTVG